MDGDQELIGSYLRFCAHREKFLGENQIDLGNVRWIYPTTLLPLADFIKQHNKMEHILPSDKTACKYISTILDGPNPKATFLTYCPLVKLPTNKEEAEAALAPLYNVQHNGRYCGGENAFKYMIGELFDNIYQHSKFTRAFVMSQRYTKKRFTEICVFDNGVTIPGSFKQNTPFGSDVEAISKALQGASSTKEYERGFGLGTCATVATVALKGEILVVSGAGAIHLSHGKTPSLLDLRSDKKLHLNGTLVSLRIPTVQETVDISKYLEKNPKL